MVSITDNHSVLRRKLAELQERHRQAVISIENDRRNIELSEIALLKLAAQVAVLDDVLREITTAPQSAVSQPEHVNGFSGLKPTEAVLHLVRAKPDLTMPEIIAELEDKVESSAKNVRHNIRTTIFNLRKAGRIRLLEDQTYRVPDE